MLAAIIILSIICAILIIGVITCIVNIHRLGKRLHGFSDLSERIYNLGRRLDDDRKYRSDMANTLTECKNARDIIMSMFYKYRVESNTHESYYSNTLADVQDYVCRIPRENTCNLYIATASNGWRCYNTWEEFIDASKFVEKNKSYRKESINNIIYTISKNDGDKK